MHYLLFNLYFYGRPSDKISGPLYNSQMEKPTTYLTVEGNFQGVPNLEHHYKRVTTFNAKKQFGLIKR